MHRAVPLISVVLLAAPAAGQVVIDMPPPPPAPPEAQAEPATEPGTVALARYARSRRAPTSVYAPGWYPVHRPWGWGYPWWGWGWHPFVVVGHHHHHGNQYFRRPHHQMALTVTPPSR
ncbi:MAG: hypothetical protein ACYS0D_00260 [Planctomycetota bacterium]|jgi:hypothetical protein